MRHLLTLCLLSGCFQMSGGDPPEPPVDLAYQFSCTAVMSCADGSSTEADFDRCRDSVDQANESVEDACEKYAAEVGCAGWACAVECGIRGVCSR